MPPILPDGQAISVDEFAKVLHRAPEVLGVSDCAVLRVLEYQAQDGRWWPFAVSLRVGTEVGEPESYEQGPVRFTQSIHSLLDMVDANALLPLFEPWAGEGFSPGVASDLCHFYRHPSGDLWGELPCWTTSLPRRRLQGGLQAPSPPRWVQRLPSGERATSIANAAALWLNVPELRDRSQPSEEFYVHLADPRAYIAGVRRNGDMIEVALAGSAVDALEVTAVVTRGSGPGDGKRTECQVTRFPGVATFQSGDESVLSFELDIVDAEGFRYDYRSEYRGISASGYVLLATAENRRSPLVPTRLAPASPASRIGPPLPREWWRVASHQARSDEPDYVAMKALLAVEGPSWPSFDIDPEIPPLGQGDVLALLGRFLVQETGGLRPGVGLHRLHWELLSAHYFPGRERYEALRQLVGAGWLREGEGGRVFAAISFPVGIPGETLDRIRHHRLRVAMPRLAAAEQVIGDLTATFPTSLKLLAGAASGIGIWELLKKALRF